MQLPESGRFSTHRGYIDLAQVVGKEYGDTVTTQLHCRFVLLRPTTADFLLKVRRVTTIVYPKDAGVLLLDTCVFPGARVVEVGSGSGGLTTLLASFVRPDGRVYSYDRREDCSQAARANVQRYGLAEWCEFFVRDVATDGFEQTDVDAVFLDVPEPWTLLSASWRALKGGHPLAAIVPTAEQLREICRELAAVGFTRVRAQEILKRDMQVRTGGTRPVDRMIGHTVYIVLAHKANRTGTDRVDPQHPQVDV